jgi:hypothetical protein
MIHLLRWLRGSTLNLLLFGGGVLLLWGIFAPVGTLVWWLQQGAETAQLQLPKRGSKPRSLLKSTNAAKIDCYIVYFPGVGDYSANQLTAGEEFFLTQLTKQHPNCVAVPDVFPYSASNTSLGGERLFAPVWMAIENADGWLKNADVLIKIRNLWRFAISADARYGRVYNRGIAIAAIDRMQAAHPLPQPTTRPLKIILLGTSGGAQVALGAATYLKQSIVAPQLFVVSVGGDFEGNAGFATADRVYHLHSDRDSISALSHWIFPSRWPITVGSPFNQARQQGRYIAQTIGPQAHDGDRGYFGLARVGTSHTTYVELTLQQVNRLPIWSSSLPLQN